MIDFNLILATYPSFFDDMWTAFNIFKSLECLKIIAKYTAFSLKNQEFNLSCIVLK